jgi:DNA-binding transcriptional ArsR family regulator
MLVNDCLDRTMAALAHPVRRAILDRLMRKEMCVTELAGPFQLSLNAVSRHIRVLEDANLVQRRKQWREHWVSFNPAPLDDVSAWIEQRRVFWTAKLDALDSLLKAQDAARSRKQRKVSAP